MEDTNMRGKILSLVCVGSLFVAALLSQAVADNGPQHQVEQPRPILLGTSGGDINDISLRYCCSGTLGALVENADHQYVLSNNHVLAKTNLGGIGEAIIQPGLVDQRCQRDTRDTVAYLSSFVTLRFKSKDGVPINKVDAAIAEVIPGCVDPNGAIIDVGQVSSQATAATVGMAVKKSGRTTGLTSGVVQSINVTVDVGYSDECGGAATKVARFQNQIFIGPSGFSAGGDSGSLIVENVATNPRAVGLLFAGSPSVTVANPIGEVLSALAVNMVGGAPPSAPKGSISGRVTNAAGGAAIEGAQVSVDSGQSDITDSAGSYLIEDIPVGSHVVQATKTGFKPKSQTAVVNENQNTTVNFALRAQKGKSPQSKKEAINKAIAAKNRHQDSIMAIDGVVGVGVGHSKEDQPVVQVYLKSDSGQTRSKLPKVLDDVAVEVIVTGEFIAF